MIQKIFHKGKEYYKQRKRLLLFTVMNSVKSTILLLDVWWTLLFLTFSFNGN